MSQLSLELDPSAANPAAAFFDADGKPRRLLWCSDTTRIAFRNGEAAPCPYTEPHPRSRADGELLPPIGLRFRPTGGCCKDLEGARARTTDPDRPSEPGSSASPRGIA